MAHTIRAKVEKIVPKLHEFNKPNLLVWKS